MTIDTADIINNPLKIQEAILDSYESNVDGGSVVVDANNTFSFLVETFSRLTAGATTAIDNKLNALYPIRANTTKELFNHLSDFDYVGFFSYPAALRISMVLHRDYLVKNAVTVPDTGYQLVVIPADTIFTVGRYRFGMYYPIHIKINPIVNSISASYDTTENNPLKSLDTNTIEVKSDTYQGIDLISIEFDVYQFDKTVYQESINPDIGFIKSYKYDNKFYSLRVFDNTSGVKKELSYTMSDSVYDINIPTINFKVFPETNEVTLSIPQIYLTSGKIGTRLLVELHTSLGALDVSLANIDIQEAVSVNFAMNSPNTDLTYTNLLKNIPTIIISPVDTRIVGGSNSYTFEEMKNYTIYHNGASRVPITRMDLNQFFSENGFTYMTKIDNLTDRRYYAYRKLNLNNQDLSVTSGGLTILVNESVQNDSVLYQNNETIVVLPTAIYKFVPSINKLTILNNEVANTVRNGSANVLETMLNNEKLYCNPHHIVITTSDRYPICELYDLFTTAATNLTFIEENAYLSAQLSIVNVQIRHLNNGAGGYTVRVGVKRSEDLKDVPSNELNCYLSLMAKSGFRVGVRAIYVGEFSGIDVFDFTISTNYKLKNDKLTITNFSMEGYGADAHEIDLNGQMYISTFVKKTRFSTVPQDDTIIHYLTDDDESWLGISLQRFDYSLGTNLSDILDPNLLTNWTNVEYETYDADVPLVYEHDVYERDTNGLLKYSIVADKVVTNKLHNAGDVVYNTDNSIVYKNRKGDIKVGLDGIPIAVSSRVKDFTIDLSVFDYGHNVTITDFFINVSKDLSSYYSRIRGMNESVLENTNIFFKPIITSSTGRYRINNSTVIESSLELALEFNCYVAQATMDDQTMTEAIISRITTIVNTHLSYPIISLLEIGSAIKADLSTYVNSVDTVSLNGDKYIQTIMNIDIDKSPKLGSKLSVGRDGRLSYVSTLVVNFKALDT
jgi:hypothetical protein